MGLIVQKYGGSSIASLNMISEVSSRIIKSKEAGNNLVVVVSAMGRKGFPYSTDSFLEFINTFTSKPNPRELDFLLSCGEIISAVILASSLRAKGYNTIALSGGQAGIITDNKFNEAEIIELIPNALEELILKDYIPIVAGFQGITKNGDITTLGRGGSDITALALGEALDADEVEIYTDVDGVMTADPKLVDKANLIEFIGYKEILEMADHGTKVIHPRAIEYAYRSNMPVKIKNSLKEVKGTLISSKYEKSLERKEYNIEQIITAIAYVKDRVQISIDYNSISESKNILARLAENDISIDIINIFPKKMVFTIDAPKKERAISIVRKTNLKFSLIENLSKVTIIGSKMRGVPGVMASIIDELEKNEISILQTADSHTTISCLINDMDMIKALKVLHRKFNLDKKD